MDDQPMDPLAKQRDQPLTHASRHPEKEIIPPRPNYQKTTRAQRETAKVQAALKQDRKKALQREINAFLEQREKFAVELAEKFNLKVEMARRLVNDTFTTKEARAPSTWNVLVSHRGKELNEGQTKGDRLSLREIQEIVQQEIDDREHNAVDNEELQEELKESRELNSKGAHSSNRAAAVDYNASLWQVEME
ncbi:hypothetical protein DXG01_012114, partial [Tephrocybe rancida]